MRRALVVVSLLLATAALYADVVTLPAAASIQGGNPFFSDVRVFNTSYSDSLAVTATYRCFIAGGGAAGGACPASAPSIQINLAPRESKAFDDMVASADGFNAHDTAGGVEFEFSGAEDQLVVTSRLFSTSPQNSVGMFIPGLDESDAHTTTVLTSIRHTAATNGVGTFRTNVGVFNPEDGATNVTFTIFDGGTNQLGNPVVRNVPGHSGVQVSGIFEAAGAASADTENAVIVVSADSEVFSYAAVLDNNTADPIFVVGAEDQPQQPITPVPVTAVATPTTSPAGPTPTPTPPAGITATVNIGQGGEHVFVDVATGTNTTTIHVGDTVHWVWVDSFHSTTSDTGVWDSGQNATPHTFDRQFTSAGSFPYHCTVHGPSMNGTVVVNP
jgi:plastocyanin